MCAKWAAKGECSANPNYMVGGGSHPGQCRKSCKVCSTKLVLADAIHDDKTLVGKGWIGKFEPTLFDSIKET